MARMADPVLVRGILAAHPARSLLDRPVKMDKAAVKRSTLRVSHGDFKAVFNPPSPQPGTSPFHWRSATSSRRPGITEEPLTTPTRLGSSLQGSVGFMCMLVWMDKFTHTHTQHREGEAKRASPRPSTAFSSNLKSFPRTKPNFQ